MLFALVHAGENVVIEDIAADFRSQTKLGAGLIWMESKEQAAQLKVLLEKESRDASECKYKVVNGPRPKHGSVQPLHRGCGEEWPALFCGRASDTEGMTVRGRFKTPLGETLYICEINFWPIKVAGSFQCTMAVLHRNMAGEVSDLSELPWAKLADICCGYSVRIIGGHLSMVKHPLIAELEKTMPTTTILANIMDPHPYCVLGGIQTTVGVDGRIPWSVHQFEEPNTKYHGLVRFPMLTVKHPETSVANTTKCLLLVNGSNATRPRGHCEHLIIPKHRRSICLS